jgi:hypothetical protein
MTLFANEVKNYLATQLNALCLRWGSHRLSVIGVARLFALCHHQEFRCILTNVP